MTEQPQQIDIQKFTDLDFAELMQNQMALLFQAQQNIQQLQAELARRKALIEKKDEHEK